MEVAFEQQTQRTDFVSVDFDVFPTLQGSSIVTGSVCAGQSAESYSLNLGGNTDEIRPELFICE